MSFSSSEEMAARWLAFNKGKGLIEFGGSFLRRDLQLYGYMFYYQYEDNVDEASSPGCASLVRLILVLVPDHKGCMKIDLVLRLYNVLSDVSFCAQLKPYM